jgi:hypothetical protein
MTKWLARVAVMMIGWGASAAMGLGGAVAVAEAAGTRGYAEFGTGLEVPAADSDYRGLVRPSVKLAFRALYLPSVTEALDRRLGLEWAADFVPYRDEFAAPSSQFGQIDFYRARLLLGVRYLWNRSPNLIVFGRALGGLDILATEEESRVAGLIVHDSDADLGVAAELGGGVLWRFGGVTLGAQLAVPLALQPGSGPGDVSVFDADWFSIDVDILLTVGTKL